MSASLRKVEIGLHRRGAEHHVEPARPDFRHVARHDAGSGCFGMTGVRASVHFGLMPSARKPIPSGSATALRQWQDARRARPPSGGRFRAARPKVRTGRPAPAKSRAPPIGVVEADQIARRRRSRSQPSRSLHALEQRANAALAPIGHRRQVRAVEGNLLVFGADPKRRGRLAAGLQPGDERVARFHEFGVNDIAGHEGDDPGRRAGEGG